MAANTESSAPPPSEVRFVDKGLRAAAHFPDDPQTFLWKTNHPYAPFCGNPLTWESYMFDDGTTYEGLCREEVPHGLGVMTIGNVTGGGLQHPEPGDLYEGEFYSGFVHGLGALSSLNGEMYRGEFHSGKKQGCGMVANMSPFFDRVKNGEDPDEAWKLTKDKIFADAKFGTWKRDYYIAEPDDSGTGRYCHINEIKATLTELTTVLTKARMFQWKPDGEVTFRTAIDDDGSPAPLMQDPLHYPFGTKFMAPGPMGQCFPVPDDPNIQRALRHHAHNYWVIHNRYNFDYDVEPGSVMWKAEKYHKKLIERKKARILLLKEKQRRKKRLQKRREGKQAKKRAEAEREKAAKGKAPSKRGEKEGAKTEKTEGTKSEGEKPEAAKPEAPKPTGPLASLTFGFVRGAAGVAHMFEQAALRARPIPRLARPSIPKVISFQDTEDQAS